MKNIQANAMQIKIPIFHLFFYAPWIKNYKTPIGTKIVECFNKKTVSCFRTYQELSITFIQWLIHNPHENKKKLQLSNFSNKIMIKIRFEKVGKYRFWFQIATRFSPFERSIKCASQSNHQSLLLCTNFTKLNPKLFPHFRN